MSLDFFGNKATPTLHQGYDLYVFGVDSGVLNLTSRSTQANNLETLALVERECVLSEIKLF